MTEHHRIETAKNRYFKDPFLLSMSAIAETAAENFATIHNHSQKDIDQFSEIMPRLLRDADVALLQTVASLIFNHPQLPERLKQFLTTRLDMTELVLAQFSRQRAQQKATSDTPRQIDLTMSDHAACLALAKSPELGSAEIDGLLKSGDAEICKTLIECQRTQLTLNQKAILIGRARTDRELANLIFAEFTLDKTLFPLFLFANDEQRKNLLTCAHRSEIGNNHTIPLKLDITRLRDGIKMVAERRDVIGFINILSMMLGCSQSLANDLLDDEGGEPLMVTMAAFGIGFEVAARVFMLLTPQIATSYPKVHDLLRTLSQLPQPAALKLLVEFSGARHLLPLSPSTNSKGQPNQRDLRLAQDKAAATRYLLASHASRAQSEPKQTSHNDMSQTG